MSYAFKIYYRHGLPRTKQFRTREGLLRFYAKHPEEEKNIERFAIPGKGVLKIGEQTLDGITREIALMRQIVQLKDQLKRANAQP
jgi:hypothetical protein